jgi:hypothetical protein
MWSRAHIGTQIEYELDMWVKNARKGGIQLPRTLPSYRLTEVVDHEWNNILVRRRRKDAFRTFKYPSEVEAEEMERLKTASNW